jgi:hypothetical protein
MAKSSKRFILSDSSLNQYGFRLLTQGADLDSFLRNPIMLFMHIRSFGPDSDQVLAIGYWDDVRVEGDAITAVPVFDDNDAFAMKIYNKVEQGIYRMASAGVEAIEFSEDPQFLLPGQKYATITKWRLEEASIVDIGANKNALAFYDRYGTQIQLSTGQIPAFIPKLKHTSQMNLSALIAALNLQAPVQDDQVIKEAVNKLRQLADENERLHMQLNDLQKKQQQEQINNLINEAIASGKILASQKQLYLTLAEKDFENTRALIESMQPYVPVREQLASHQQKCNEKWLAMSWDELDKSGKLAELKATNPEAWREKFKEKFGKEPVQ